MPLKIREKTIDDGLLLGHQGSEKMVVLMLCAHRCRVEEKHRGDDDEGGRRDDGDERLQPASKAA